MMPSRLCLVAMRCFLFACELLAAFLVRPIPLSAGKPQSVATSPQQLPSLVPVKIDKALIEEALVFTEPICLSGPPAGLEWHIRELLRRGEALRPAFEAIIADSNSDPVNVSGAFDALVLIKARGPQYSRLAGLRLSDKSNSIRQSALAYLQHFGGTQDASKVVPFLSDPHYAIRKLAATTLAKIGGKPDLDAMDAWLKDGKHPADGDYMIHVKKCRDELEKRVKANPFPKDTMH